MILKQKYIKYISDGLLLYMIINFICYIGMDGRYPINISAHTRKKLDVFFEKDHEKKDYAHLFDKAIEEVYEMLTSIYRFQFNSHKRYDS